MTTQTSFFFFIIITPVLSNSKKKKKNPSSSLSVERKCLLVSSNFAFFLFVCVTLSSSCCSYVLAKYHVQFESASHFLLRYYTFSNFNASVSIYFFQNGLHLLVRKQTLVFLVHLMSLILSQVFLIHLQ